MRYRHPGQRLHDTKGRLAEIFADIRPGRTRVPPPHELGRIGGEMARRMVEAALAYLTEQAVHQVRASFAEAAFRGARDVTADRQKA